ncbi:undecaprenyldiphospho-muramoylpentapeptide beta-N-acetylglucosaminyltransferase [Schinkia azotoformans]|uniref:UDP-N-acetylglucosamine--N-acetylmuramyl-(pentapeptide) pyrophosphoryl-undecaprenol N-acetylglucosamine transferase n=1 Tax=Schinkia azotoformans LMG 9581 TaxID=1131731 RepID=K6BUF1_SCHAZ|nr:undecaprenyldiphospho-muramoylpentapeptide beta-N-acetylglucosaminyltransferase [Schinkia azotoformans]EKN62535.1 undecaprenyldiphospho-muramoylpentapeptide beta-N- acetylglucosaminyltransferase [Schinkia azotoformans LMG 9581]MEC1640862.1 undecaprenyldiphospho-muramoylpentapeptide beta-N-acetylglucosaminyltransferase [Schinkia azotoformans]MEC1721090.1 undecaprenyldiphospho-muramoylpentapeptide beta-N-acetylglucosaminyltransferase [Schinkia azotoformans]MEC1945348.1 undecaprenyldiphospho-mu
MRILVSGGGTGGHIYPAIAFIKEIKKHQPDAEFLYIGTEKGLEKSIVERENIPFKSIEITGFKRKLSFENIKTIMRFLKGTSLSKKYIKEFKPDIVLGTGGYVCGPVVYAAAKLNIPTIIHEQNSVPGLTNKFLSKYVDKVALCFEEAGQYFPKEKTILTGNPRASEVIGNDGNIGKRSVGLDPTKKVVLIVGGSRGAKPINDAFIEVLPKVREKSYQVLYVTGDVHYENVLKEVNKVGNPDNVIIKPFLHNMPEVLAGVDLIVARAGATTLAEITALGIPSILIPSPYVTNNHQEKNARALGDNGAAIVRLEKEMNGITLLRDIDHVLLNEETLMQMKQSSARLGIPTAANKLYAVMEQLIK